MVGGYPCEACLFVKGDKGGVDLREREGGRWERWKTVVGVGMQYMEE